MRHRGRQHCEEWHCQATFCGRCSDTQHRDVTNAVTGQHYDRAALRQGSTVTGNLQNQRSTLTTCAAASMFTWSCAPHTNSDQRPRTRGTRESSTPCKRVRSRGDGVPISTARSVWESLSWAVGVAYHHRSTKSSRGCADNQETAFSREACTTW